MTSIHLCKADFDKGCVVINKAAHIAGEALLKTAKKVLEVALVVTKILLTAALIITFPGSFIAGFSVGVILPKFVDETLETISRIWKRQSIWKVESWLACGGIILLSVYGLPHTPLLASFIRGAQLGSRAALA